MSDRKPRVKSPRTYLESIVTSPTMLAIGIDPVRGEAHLMVKNGDGAVIKKKLPLSASLQAAFMAARSLLS